VHPGVKDPESTQQGLTRRWRRPQGAAPASCGEAGPRLDPRFDAPLEEGRATENVADPQHAPTLLARLLAARGIHDPDSIRRFCEPKLSDLHDPGLLPGIDVAVARVALAIERREKIAIYGDYDVDGITATAILFHVIRVAAPDLALRCYVPHRLDEGYGLNGEALRQLASEGITLVVSVDCGVTAVGPAAVAREIGLDLVITDHHHPPADGQALPDAVAIVHPGLSGSNYPFRDLCGAGVAYKVAWRLATTLCGSERVSEAFRRVLLDMLPLVALGTIADVVPLIDENRVLVTAGLRAIKESTIPGLRALISESGLAGEKIDSQKVGFVLAPRLNACGRLGHAADAVRLLTDAPADESATIAAELASLNRARQETEASIVAEACELVLQSGQDSPEHRVIVLAHEAWHPGVVGIVCSRLVERFGRPTILLQQQGEFCKGSARSIEGYSILEGLTACAGHLTTFGGHAAAAGLALPTAALEAFRTALVAHANSRIAPESLVAEIRIDCAATLDELDPRAVHEIARLSPFGRGNPRPSILLRDLVVAGEPRILKEKHLKLQLADPRHPRGNHLEVIWWNGAVHAPRLSRGTRVHAVIEPQLSSYSGRVEGIVSDLARA